MSYIAPKKWTESEYSNRNNSKPEIDFVTILTAFKNVRRGLQKSTKVPENFPSGGAGRARSRKVDLGPRFSTPKMALFRQNDFFKILHTVRGPNYLALEEVSRKLSVRFQVTKAGSEFGFGGP